MYRGASPSACTQTAQHSIRHSTESEYVTRARARARERERNDRLITCIRHDTSSFTTLFTSTWIPTIHVVSILIFTLSLPPSLHSHSLNQSHKPEQHHTHTHTHTHRISRAHFPPPTSSSVSGASFPPLFPGVRLLLFCSSKYSTARSRRSSNIRCPLPGHIMSTSSAPNTPDQTLPAPPAAILLLRRVLSLAGF